MLKLSNKLFGCVFLTGITFTFGCIVVYKVGGYDKPKNTFLATITTTSSNTQPTDEIILYGEKRNFLCNYKQVDDKTCSIEELKLPSIASKKWASKAQIQTAETSSKINKASLKTTNKFYCLQVSDDLYKAIDWNLETNLELKSTNSNETNKTFVSLKPLFPIFNSSSPIKNKLFLAKAKNLYPTSSNTTTISIPSSSSKCSIGPNNENASNLKPCQIFSFSSSQPNTSDKSSFEKLTFVGNKTNTESSIQKNNFYLIEFTEDISQNIGVDSTIIYLHQQADGSTLSKLAEFSTLHKSLFSDASASHLLIL